MENSGSSNTVAYVEQIVTRFDKADEILQRVKRERARQKAPEPSSLLIDTVHSAQRDILHEKDRALGRWGLAFCKGDTVALEGLRAIDVGLEKHFLKQLEELANNEDLSDFRHLVDDADCARDQTVNILLCLKQRLLASESKTDLPPSPPESQSSKTYHIPQHHRSLLPGGRPLSLVRTSTHASGDEDTTSGAENGPPKKHGSILNFLKHHRAHSHNEKHLGSAEANASSDDLSRKVSRASTSPLGASTSDWSFGGPRERANTQQSFRWFDSFAGTLVDAPTSQQARAHRDSLATLQSQKSLSPTTSTFSRDRVASSATAFRNSTLTVRTPTPDNNYLGWCKSAVRLQNGDKKAFEKRKEFNDGWSQSSVPYLACASNKCAFAGHMDASTIMTKVWAVEKQGLKLRWPFLAKSHVPQQKVTDNNYGFQCLFCIFKGDKTVIYYGADNYLQHVIEHRGETSAIVLYKAKCINDHVATKDEEFDLNLFPDTPDGDSQHSRRNSDMTIQSMDKIRASSEASHTPDEPWNAGLSDFHFGDEIDRREIG